MSEVKHPVAELGKYTVTAKVVKLDAKEGAKVGWAHFEGFTKGVKYFVNRKLAAPLEVGKEAELVYETVDDDFRGEVTRVSMLVSFGGASQGGNKGAGGNFRGGGSYVPKSPEEVHSASVCGCVKSAIEYAAALGIRDRVEIGQFMDLAVDRYAAGIQRVCGGQPVAPTLAVEPGGAPSDQPAAPVTDPATAVAQAVEYLAVLEIAGSQMEAFKEHCKKHGMPWVNKALSAKKAGIDSAKALYEFCTPAEATA